MSEAFDFYVVTFHRETAIDFLCGLLVDLLCNTGVSIEKDNDFLYDILTSLALFILRR